MLLTVHVCTGCLTPTDTPGKCPTCASRRDAIRFQERRYYWSKPWRRLRAKQLNRFPFCQWRLSPSATPLCGAIATEVDHIVPRSAGGEDKPENLQSLCKPHHTAKTWREQHSGGWGHPVAESSLATAPAKQRAHNGSFPTPSRPIVDARAKIARVHDL